MNERMSLKDTICLFTTTILGVGYLPLFSGTLASLVALLFFFLIKNKLLFFIFTFISLVLSFIYSSRAEELFGEKDSKKIVIDDFSGMLVSLLFIPTDTRFAIAGFFLFRIFDAIKIPPADEVEKFKGAKGIVGDDLVAGIYANLMLHGLRLTLKIFS